MEYLSYFIFLFFSLDNSPICLIQCLAGTPDVLMSGQLAIFLQDADLSSSGDWPALTEFTDQFSIFFVADPISILSSTSNSCLNCHVGVALALAPLLGRTLLNCLLSENLFNRSYPAMVDVRRTPLDFFGAVTP